MRLLLFARLRVRPLLVLALAALPGLAKAADPLEDFTQLLRQTPNVEDKEQVKAHQKLLEKGAAALVRPRDLRRALLLPEWRHGDFQQEAPGEEENPLAKIHKTIRLELSARLKTSLRDDLQAKEPGRRWAAVAFLSAMAQDEIKPESDSVPAGPATRGVPSLRFTPSMTADVRKVLVSEKDADVSAAAAGAVVAIAPIEKETLEALKPLLNSKREVRERRAAAEGLEYVVRAAADEGRAHRIFGIAPVGVGARRLSALEILGPDILTACVAGLGDEDATVRRSCLEAIHQTAQALAETLANRGMLFAPLARAVNARTKDVRGRLADKDLSVCLSAHQTLEAMAEARRHLRGGPRRPLWEGGPREPARPAADQVLLDSVLEALPELGKSLSHAEVRVRLASLYVLETLETDASPAVTVVAKAMADKNGFVRWAPRALSNMAPQAADKAVPALAAALKDENKTVRLTAVSALRRYGPKASEAAESLGAAVGDTEPRVRLGAIDALAAMGKKAASQTGALIRALKDDKTPEARAAAAKALGRLGALGRESRKALRFALRDPNAAVRQAAGDALLDNPE